MTVAKPQIPPTTSLWQGGIAKPGEFWRQTGFTLLELIVAITLMGLVLVVLYSGLRLGLNSWEGGEQRAEATNRQRLVEEFLRRQLAQSITVYRTNDGQEKAVVFTGQSNSIEFVAPMLAQLGPGGLYRVRIDGANSRLQVHFRPYRYNNPNAGEEQESVLLEGVSALEWAYFGPERDDDAEPPRWRSDWVSSERRPLLVRLNLTLRGEPWPDLVVALAEGPRR
ncbi:MAG: prepilin-type N-terminal cleavage/methylation domain-containing protein [Candidatus Competibacteraceae bacterium]|uniref:General secretion pathway protein J n=1 Tax=Candidatus Contendobacter odensis Run_B_J11 TaxID=1400861 RepID=A0A7U7G962_9GAMM|nr:prepilin-type N-terminal cleavage/methylation domain-containing protein [Candidatus Contendobacter odensis]MBK8535954.1 prepilin-type N-terminal cleavage/methylation domain-containing protein [Candidatus Competibacteraceae bacterium]MBK8750411.1 prepilin-type N-terminal cleavage/methylation domain-containing protein [Candidatus Competibacteraceae bacterium]CDH43929.1 putative General secretion pathway protein J [Candidatus Contendobacter odensis Run_B_J11]